MTRFAVLATLLAMPLAGCASDKLIQAPVATPEAARARVAFCDVANPMEAVAGDPTRTQVQKAGHNGTGAYLCGWDR
ncbi:hypothetical protein [Chelatococcus sp.]|uniref:hypothetical protein n=1 Tax=Chelatococcus sp. TaxID=1953771 RepID=UPI001ECC63C5|nr:hypothetical protein [Chelatococcus sp.]MBX3543566.1 hypothetical protein [Chelatococcus sp.]